MKIYFENTATFITAARADGAVVIRCNFNLTDCGDNESLEAFVARHGGENATAEYLQDCYRQKLGH